MNTSISINGAKIIKHTILLHTQTQMAHTLLDQHESNINGISHRRKQTKTLQNTSEIQNVPYKNMFPI